jgi:hypothetical protein
MSASRHPWAFAVLLDAERIEDYAARHGCAPGELLPGFVSTFDPPDA